MSESDDHFPYPKRRSLRRLLPQSTQQPNNPLNCPRCESTNTKFCYYNNYNKTQPRYLCKACKRHWTKGGTLRNVPIGGGRKNKRLRRRTAATATDETSDVSKLETGKRRDDAESYTDIEELKGLVSWDFYESFQETSSFLEVNNNSSWINDLDLMVFEDLNKPWEDPTFEK